MAAPDWDVFAAAALLATAVLLVLSRASARALHEGGRGEAGTHADAGDAVEHAAERPAIPTGAGLLANVALTHGLLGAVLVALVWWTGVPAAALGAGSVRVAGVGTGLGLGLGIYLASEATTAIARHVGYRPDERLRALLAPGDAREWALLLVVVLPLIAATEELLFRGILVGAVAAGFDLPLRLLVVGSSVLFGLGHSAQGGLGVAVTALLGLVLGTAYVLTGSLLVVVLAHYTVDVLEFVVHEAVLDGDRRSPPQHRG